LEGPVSFSPEVESYTEIVIVDDLREKEYGSDCEELPFARGNYAFVDK
jgi:hypothetical protein